MINIREIKVQVRRLNILSKFYNLTRTGDISISTYCNKYFKPSAVNNVNYTKLTGA